MDLSDCPQIIQDEAQAIARLSSALGRLHGEVRPMRESSGLMLYVCCPDCLQVKGREELFDRKLAVNVDRYLRLGKFKTLSADHADYSGYCMRMSKIYKVSDLLKRYTPIQQRGFPEARVGVAEMQSKLCLIDDGRGNMIPDHPGDVVSLAELPEDHPAIVYLTKRGYSISGLIKQFRASFCFKEAPVDWSKGRGYRVVYDDFLDTPQNRIIFYGDMYGVQRGWQARVLDAVKDGTRYYLHPYTNQWMPAEHKVGNDWEPLPHILEARGKFNISKYKTAFSASRNEMLMGLDAALEWNKEQRAGKPKVAILAEGPLDAGRWGAPGIPLLGKHFSPTQMRLLAGAGFERIIYSGQNDTMSQKLGKDIELACLGKMQFAAIYPPKEFKDYGDMTTVAAFQHAWPIIEKFYT